MNLFQEFLFQGTYVHSQQLQDPVSHWPIALYLPHSLEGRIILLEKAVDKLNEAVTMPGLYGLKKFSYIYIPPRSTSLFRYFFNGVTCELLNMQMQADVQHGCMK